MRWNTPVPPQFPPWGFLPLPSPAAASKQSHLSPVTPHQSQRLSLKNWPTRLHNEYMHLIIQILTPLLEGFPADIFSTTADQEICCHRKNLSSEILRWSLILRSLFLPQRIAYCPRKQYWLSVVLVGLKGEQHCQLSQDLAWSQWCYHTNCLIVVQLTRNGIAQQVSSSPVNHANYSLSDSLASLCPMPLPLPLLLLFKLHSSTILLLSFHCRAIIVVRVLCSDTLGRAITPHNYPSPLKHRQLDVPEAFTSTFVNYALTYARPSFIHSVILPLICKVCTLHGFMHWIGIIRTIRGVAGRKGNNNANYRDNAD